MKNNPLFFLFFFFEAHTCVQFHKILIWKNEVSLWPWWSIWVLKRGKWVGWNRKKFPFEQKILQIHQIDALISKEFIPIIRVSHSVAKMTEIWIMTRGIVRNIKTVWNFITPFCFTFAHSHNVSLRMIRKILRVLVYAPVLEM